MRQLLQDDMKKNNWCCNCIRCREVKDNSVNINDIRIDIEKYKGSSGDEYFISLVTDKYLIGFIRLRLIKYENKDNMEREQLSVLHGSALIRELHIYSNMSDVGNNVENSYQHKGYGKKLLETAEHISKTEGYNKIAVISGTGVRNYYRKNGYELIDTYMIKVF
jgi:elongator complex protein 3